MPRPARPWFRFYTEALSDRKMRRLDPAQRWLWVAVLGAARMSPRPGTLLVSDREPMLADDIADVAGMDTADVERTLPIFEHAGMLHRDDDLDAWVVTNWADRQFESDDVTKRTTKHRSREQGRNVPKAFPGTPPETETEAEAEPERSTDEPHPPATPAATRTATIEAAADIVLAARDLTGKGPAYRAATLAGIIRDLTTHTATTPLDNTTPAELAAHFTNAAAGCSSTPAPVIREMNGRRYRHVPGSGFVELHEAHA